MALPASRDQLKEYCLRNLGKPVIDINVDGEQLEDRIDEAIEYYRDYHFDGTERVFYKHIATAQDIQNGYIDVPDSIYGVTGCFTLGGTYSVNNLFNVRYQIHLNDLYDLLQSSVVPYVMAMTHINFLEEIFVGKQPIRYNRHKNRVHIDTSWTDKIPLGSFIILDAYQVIDPDVNTDMYSDRWLLRYTTALFKRQWGENIKKFEGLQMPGGLTFNGQKIWEEATEEIRKLEDEMISSYSLPVHDMIG
jgi:hypothetical protein